MTIAEQVTHIDAEPPPERATAARRVEVNVPLTILLAGAIVAGIWLMPGAVLFLAILSALVVIHEGAHLSAARRAGIHCSEFAMGFGPRVAAVRVGELVVALRLFPAGGFVNVTGMTATEEVDSALEARTYRAAPLRSKLAVVFAGPMANLALGLGLAVIAFGPLTPAAERTENPVGEAAVWTGSLFTTSFEGYADLVRSIDDYPETIASRGAEGDATRVMSPVAAAQLTGQASDAGIVWVTLFASIVSVALGAFNLLPIIPLDGGQGAVAIIEAAGTRLRGSRFVVPAAATKATAVALLGFLLLLSASATYLDVVDPYGNPFEG